MPMKMNAKRPLKGTLALPNGRASQALQTGALRLRFVLERPNIDADATTRGLVETGCDCPDIRIG